MTAASIQSGTVFTDDGQILKAQNANNPWSLTGGDDGALRFELQPGDQWDTDPATKNRTEVAVLGNSVTDGTPIHVAYTFSVEPGTGSNAIIGQFHQDENTNGIAPPLAISLVNDKMAVTVGYLDNTSLQTTRTIFTDSATITRGATYAIDISVTFGANGDGHVLIARNGQTIAQYDGPLGWSSSESLYWKEGIYGQTANQNLAVSYNDLSISTASAVASPATKDNNQQYTTYDSGGRKLSTYASDGAGTTRTTSFDATGAPAKVVQTNPDGSLSINDYGITGQSYTSDLRLYNAAGTLVELDTDNAAGTRISTDSYAVTGQPYTAVHQSFDASGRLVSSLYSNINGSTTANSYAAGVLTKVVQTNADGSQVISDYGIAGQSYTSDLRLYNASGSLVELDTFNAAGTRISIDNYAVAGQTYTVAHESFDASGRLVSAFYTNKDGSTTANSYTGGALTKVVQTNLDASQSINDYGITGQSYTSDLRLYNAAGTLVELDTYSAAGTSVSTDSYAVTGQRYTTAHKSFDVSGRLISAFYKNKDGSTTANSYTAGTLIKAVLSSPDGSQSISDYGIAGQSYTSDLRLYNAAGTLVELDTFDAAGTRISIDSYAVTGQPYTAVHQSFDASGRLVSALYTNKDGSTTTNSYSAGALTKAVQTNSDGSQSISDYGIDGQSYPSDLRLYNGAGTLTELDTFNAAGTRISIDSYAVAGQAYTAAHQNFDMSGWLVSALYMNKDGSTTTESYAAGVLSKVLTRAPDGSQAINDYGITGQSYTSDLRLYNAAGTLVELDTYNAAGSRVSADNYAVTGKTYTAAHQSFDTSGQLVSALYTNKDGSTTTNSYAAGVLSKALTRIADGSQSINDYGLVGQSYTSDLRLYNGAGTLVEFDTYNAAGTRVSTDSYAVTGQIYTAAHQSFDASGLLLSSIYLNNNGSTTTSSYTAGALTKSLTRAADSSQSINDYGITGQSYTSDLRLYNAAGTLVEFDTYNAAGTRVSTDSYTVTGQPYTAAHQSFDAAGRLVGALYTNKDGSTTTNTYTAGVLTKALIRAADGSQSINDYGITGQSYTSDLRVYNGVGTLLQFDAFRPDGSVQVQAFAPKLTLTGGSGNDTFASAGSDSFVFNGFFGNDSISHFVAGSAANHDVLQLSKSAAPDFMHLNVQQHGSDTVIVVSPGNSITLQHVVASALTANNFAFA